MCPHHLYIFVFLDLLPKIILILITWRIYASFLAYIEMSTEEEKTEKKQVVVNLNLAQYKVIGEIIINS